MTVAVMMDVLMSVGAKLDNLWSMYIVVHLGILWFLFLVHRPLLVIERLIALIAYAGFVYVNGWALMHSYALFDALRIDLVTQFGKELMQVPETMRFMSESAASRSQGAQDLIVVSHGVALVIVVLLLLFRNSMIRYYYRLYPDFGAKKVEDA